MILRAIYNSSLFMLLEAYLKALQKEFLRFVIAFGWLTILWCTWTGRINSKILLNYINLNYQSLLILCHCCFTTKKALKLTFAFFQLQLMLSKRSCIDNLIYPACPCAMAQCPRMELNKRSLPKAMTTAGWKLIPHGSKISMNWNPPHWDPITKFSKKIFLDYHFFFRLQKWFKMIFCPFSFLGIEK